MTPDTAEFLHGAVHEEARCSHWVMLVAVHPGKGQCGCMDVRSMASMVDLEEELADAYGACCAGVGGLPEVPNVAEIATWSHAVYDLTRVFERVGTPVTTWSTGATLQ